jgi:hypothetical protein
VRDLVGIIAFIILRIIGANSEIIGCTHVKIGNCAARRIFNINSIAITTTVITVVHLIANHRGSGALVPGKADLGGRRQTRCENNDEIKKIGQIFFGFWKQPEWTFRKKF